MCAHWPVLDFKSFHILLVIQDIIHLSAFSVELQSLQWCANIDCNSTKYVASDGKTNSTVCAFVKPRESSPNIYSAIKSSDYRLMMERQLFYNKRKSFLQSLAATHLSSHCFQKWAAMESMLCCIARQDPEIPPEFHFSFLSTEREIWAQSIYSFSSTHFPH